MRRRRARIKDTTRLEKEFGFAHTPNINMPHIKEYWLKNGIKVDAKGFMSVSSNKVSTLELFASLVEAGLVEFTMEVKMTYTVKMSQEEYEEYKRMRGGLE